jgi:hypothetical protein
MNSHQVPLAACAMALVAGVLAAGPVEFGTAELDRAIAERGLNPKLFRIKTEVSVDPPESYRIIPGLITGGDLRGVMYGLLEAARQIRETGRLRKANGAPALAIRGVRASVQDFEADGAQSREYWAALFQSLARNRFNRFSFVVPNPFEKAERLQFISQTAADYGVDFTLGLGDDPGAPAGPALQASLAKLLAACPSIRSVQLRMQAEAAMYAVRAVQDAGRRLTLEVTADTPAISGAAASAGIPLRIPVGYPNGARPETGHPFYWEITRPSARDRRSVQAVITKFLATGSSGFELDLPVPGEALPALYPLWGVLGYDPGTQ